MYLIQNNRRWYGIMLILLKIRRKKITHLSLPNLVQSSIKEKYITKENIITSLCIKRRQINISMDL